MRVFALVREAVETGKLHDWTTVSQLKGLIAEANDFQEYSDDDLDLILASAKKGMRQKQVDTLSEAFSVLADFVNRMGSDKSIVADAMRGVHPYLLNELILSLLAGTKKKCRYGDGSWDGRISITLQDYMDQYIV